MNKSQPGQPLNVKRTLAGVPKMVTAKGNRIHHGQNGRHIPTAVNQRTNPLNMTQSNSSSASSGGPASRPASATANRRPDKFVSGHTTGANHKQVVANGFGLASKTPATTPVVDKSILPTTHTNGTTTVNNTKNGKLRNVSVSNAAQTPGPGGGPASLQTPGRITSLTRGGPLLTSQKIEILTKDLFKSRDRVKNQEVTIMDLERQLVTCQRTSAALTLCLRHITTQYDPFRMPALLRRNIHLEHQAKQHDNILAETQQANEEQMGILMENIQLLSAQLGTLQGQYDALKARENKLEADLNAAETELQAARTQAEYLVKKRSKALHESNQRLENDNASLKAVLDMKTDRVRNLERDLLRAESDAAEIPALKSMIRQLEQQCEQLECTARAKTERCEEVVKLYYELKADFERTSHETHRLHRRTEELEYVLSESVTSEGGMSTSISSRSKAAGVGASKSIEDTPLPLPLPAGCISTASMTRSLTASMMTSGYKKSGSNMSLNHAEEEIGEEVSSSGESYIDLDRHKRNMAARRNLFSTPCRKSNSFSHAQRTSSPIQASSISGRDPSQPSSGLTVADATPLPPPVMICSGANVMSVAASKSSSMASGVNRVGGHSLNRCDSPSASRCSPRHSFSGSPSMVRRRVGVAAAPSPTKTRIHVASCSEARANRTAVSIMSGSVSSGSNSAGTARQRSSYSMSSSVSGSMKPSVLDPMGRHLSTSSQSINSTASSNGSGVASSGLNIGPHVTHRLPSAHDSSSRSERLNSIDLDSDLTSGSSPNPISVSYPSREFQPVEAASDNARTPPTQLNVAIPTHVQQAVTSQSSVSYMDYSSYSSATQLLAGREPISPTSLGGGTGSQENLSGSSKFVWPVTDPPIDLLHVISSTSTVPMDVDSSGYTANLLTTLNASQRHEPDSYLHEND